MVLEDAHWVDPTTLELFDLVVQRLERLPVLLVVTYRPEFRPPWTGHTHVTALTLNPLGRGAAEAIIGQLAADKRLPVELTTEILAKTEGVPLFVEELTKAVLEAGWLRETADAYVLDGPLPRLAIPTTLQDSLTARLDRLASKQVAQVGAVIGREFSRDILAAVTGMVESRLDEATAQLSDAGLAFVHVVSPEVTYTFKHALVQDAGYQSLLKSRRRQIHAKVADVLEVRFPTIAEAEPERLAHHLTEAGLADRAAQWWLRAAEQAWQRTAYREAAAHLSRGIGMIASLPATPERQDLEARLQNMLALVHLTAWGPSAEAEAALARARALSAATGNSEEEFAATFGQWDLFRQRANAPAILRLARELLGTLRRETSKLLVLQAHHAAWTSYWTCGEYEAACRHAEVGVGLYRPEAHHTLAGQFAHHDAGVCCRCTLGIAGQLLGHSEHAKARTAEALDLAASLNRPQTRITALAYAVCINALRRDTVRVRELAETTAEECQQQGVLKFGAAAEFMLAWAEAALGAGGAARARMAHMLAEMAERRYRLRRSFFLGLQAAACLDANEAAEGLAAVKEALAFAEAHGERWYEPELHRLHGELLLRTSRNGRDEAETAFLRALGAARAAGARWLELRATASLARVWEEQGKRRKAHDLLAPIYDWFTEGFDTPDLREAKALLETLC